ncbi:MAG: hypothetical protein K5784_08250 [Clostridiales bacterium]|nr:hypothetical protein [Clostridiales bacterium]
MKALRIIKIILLIATIVALAVPAAGSVFILRDKCKYSEQLLTADEISQKLDAYEFKLGSLFSAKGEGEDVPPADEPADDIGDPEDEVNWDDNGTTGENVTEPSGEPAETDTTGEWSDIAPDTPVLPAEYSLESHNNIVLGLMKAANAKINLSFLDDLSVNIDNTDYANENGKFFVNTWVLVGAGCLFIASILHFISKKIGKKGKGKKTFWGVVLMIIGFILFYAIFALGQVIANFNPLAFFDKAAFRIYAVAGFTCAAAVIYLVFDRLGVRAMQVKNLKHRLAKKER